MQAYFCRRASLQLARPTSGCYVSSQGREWGRVFMGIEHCGEGNLCRQRGRGKPVWAAWAWVHSRQVGLRRVERKGGGRAETERAEAIPGKARRHWGGKEEARREPGLPACRNTKIPKIG